MRVTLVHMDVDERPPGLPKYSDELPQPVLINPSQTFPNTKSHDLVAPTPLLTVPISCFEAMESLVVNKRN